MRFGAIVSALVAAVAATPVSDLATRAATCSGLGFHSINVAGQTLNVKGPFKISASAPGSKLNGNFAHSGAPNYVPFLVFGVTPSQAAKRASEYYLTDGGNLVQIQDGQLYIAYEQSPTDTTGSYVSMGTGSAVNTGAEVYCAIDGPTCNFYCGLWALTYNCLGSTAFQPDWLITGTSEASKPGCVKFTPKVVPG